MIEEDKVTLVQQRASLVESLASQLPAPERVRIQGELSIVNAKIKALNTTQAAQLKAAADRRRIAGMAEAQANATRAASRAKTKTWPSSAPGEPGFGDPINRRSIDEDEDADPGQAEIDGWIDAVLLRHDVEFARGHDSKLKLAGPSKWTAVLETLITGVYAAAYGQELPELSNVAPKAKTPKPQTSKKPKKS
jgi:hypothetical protein